MKGGEKNGIKDGGANGRTEDDTGIDKEIH